jgi:hypothetical protein
VAETPEASSPSHHMAEGGACGKAPDVLHNLPTDYKWGLL